MCYGPVLVSFSLFPLPPTQYILMVGEKKKEKECATHSRTVCTGVQRKRNGWCLWLPFPLYLLFSLIIGRVFYLYWPIIKRKIRDKEFSFTCPHKDKCWRPARRIGWRISILFMDRSVLVLFPLFGSTDKCL